MEKMNCFGWPYQCACISSVYVQIVVNFLFLFKDLKLVKLFGTDIMIALFILVWILQILLFDLYAIILRKVN